MEPLFSPPSLSLEVIFSVSTWSFAETNEKEFSKVESWQVLYFVSLHPGLCPTALWGTSLMLGFLSNSNLDISYVVLALQRIDFPFEEVLLYFVSFTLNCILLCLLFFFNAIDHIKYAFYLMYICPYMLIIFEKYNIAKKHSTSLIY